MGTYKELENIIYINSEKKKLFTIRKCTFDDLEGVKAVNERELPEDYPFFFYKSILDNFPESFLIACPLEEPKKIIGYIMWRVERTPSQNSLRLINKGHLVSIAVSKKYRKRGIASALLTYSMPELLRYNIKEYVLEVRISNYGAIGLYEKFNFKTESIKKKYYKDGEDAYYMICKIGHNLNERRF
ncbi:MAG: GNAT family N-acetyltransferase [Promethearchaeota archaeon]